MRSSTPARTHPSTHRLVILLAIAAVAIGPVPSIQAQDPSTGLRITEILAVPDATQGQREFIEIWNPTNSTVDLVGWKLRDAATASGTTNDYTFSSGHLAAGARLVVWSNGSADARGPSWSTSPSKTVWNDAGDAATLLDPTGEVVDWMAYGNSAAVPPEAFASFVKPAAPARGLSVALDGSEWKPGAPTPALAPGMVGGMAGLTVLNVAPDARLVDVPATAKPGETLAIGLAAEDANGAADLAGWEVAAGGANVAEGTGAPMATVALTAPLVSGPWTLSLTVTDSGGLLDVATAVVQVRDARLSVVVPGGVLRFPDLRPGDGAVEALDLATVHNEGADPVVPLLDVSPFTGAGGEIGVEGNLEVGIQAAGGDLTWIAYEGPLTALPSLAPGTSVQLALRLLAVPTPLAAGAYGTTFAVVAA